MPQLSTLRLLLSSSPSVAFNPLSRFNGALLLKPRSPLTALAHADRRPRRGGGGGKGGSFQPRRGSSTQRKEEMAAAEGMGFNKRRAEGRDKGDKPKTLQLKTRKLNPVNTICYVQILGTGMDTQDTSPSVLLFFDKQRFIFNAGEGLQRFCTEHKIKLSKIDHMFLTRVCSETGGGLPGLLLTLAGIGEEGMSVNIWGPSDLNYLVDAMKSFIPNAAMVHTHSFGEKQNGKGVTSSDSQVGSCPDPVILIDDEVVRISAIPLKPRYSKDLGEANGDSGICELNTLGREEKRSPFSNPLTQYSEDLQRETVSVLKPGDISVIYACELSEIKGKFDPNKAASLGLKPGPKYRELQLGNSVVSDHLDITVHPSDVLGPSIPGPVVLIVDCPTQFHMLELFSVQSLNCYYADTLDHPKESLKSVNCIIHLGPSSVTKNVDYQNWMKRFGRAQHIMAGHEINNMEIPILKSSARIAARLNYLCPQFFPARGFSSPHHANNFCEGVIGSCEDTSTNCESISAENLLKFHLRPYTQLGLDRTVIPTRLGHSEIVKELLSEIPEIDDVTQHVNQFWQSPKEGKLTMPPNDNHVIMVEEPWISESSCIPNANLGKEGPHASREDTSSADGSQEDKVGWNSDIPACLENITREDMEIILLGTGSSQPSKYRNVSSIYINLFSKGSLLLDCGEGTLAQLKRRFGVEGADDAVKSLRCIWISHIHADHHTGLARILALRCHLLKGVPHEPLLVIGPRQLKRFLDAYSRLEDLNMQFLDCRHTTEDAQSLLDFHDSGGNSSPEHGNKSNNGAGNVENTTSHQLKNTFFTQGARMQNYWKRPGSPIDTGMALPVLTKMKEVLHEAGLEALYSVPVVHCPQAFGIVLKAAERINRIGKTIPGWKLVYSGDTRPCQALIDASRDATVLIHEATFEDGMGDEANSRNHSTTMEAIKVGTAADAYRIILTHFSQRYPKIPVFDESHMHKTCIAFDLMSINVADLPVLPKVLPYLKVLFRNEMVVDESVDESDEVMNSSVY